MAPRKSKTSKMSKPSSVNLTVNDPAFYEGTNEFLLPNGDRYMGEYMAHISGQIWREGRGIYVTADGHTYDGVWYNDKLQDHTEVNIRYQDGTEYCGNITNSKYNGSGCMKLANGLRFFATFHENQPINEVLLEDFDGRTWYGKVAKNEAYLAPENIFFSNINQHRGKNLEYLQTLEPVWRCHSGESQDDMQSEAMSYRQLEKIIFAKSTLTEAKIDFTDSSWYKNFIKYKTMRESVLDKIKIHEPLTNEEAKWYMNYARYKRNYKQRALEKAILEASARVDTSLLDKYYSKEFALSCKPYSVFYPSYNWVTSEEESLIISSKGSGRVSMRDTATQVDLIQDSVTSITTEEQPGEEQEEVESTHSAKCVDTESLFNLIENIMGEGHVKRLCSKSL